jgi:hypothetical protein
VLALVGEVLGLVPLKPNTFHAEMRSLRGHEGRLFNGGVGIRGLAWTAGGGCPYVRFAQYHKPSVIVK